MKTAFSYNVLVEMTRGELESYIAATRLALEMNSGDLRYFEGLVERYGYQTAALKFPRGVHWWNLKEMHRDLVTIEKELPF